MTDALPTSPDEPPAVTPAVLAIEDIKARFAEQYPHIHRLASFQHRRLHGDQHDDAVAETIGRTWKAYREKAMAGDDPTPLLGSMVRYAAMHVRAGKLLGRSESRDVMSRSSRKRNGYHVTSLPQTDDEEVAGEVRDALRHCVPGPAEEAACRVDYADWLASLSEKQRTVAEGLRSGLNLTEIAERREVSKAAMQDCKKTIERKWDERFGKTDRGR